MTNRSTWNAGRPVLRQCGLARVLADAALLDKGYQADQDSTHEGQRHESTVLIEEAHPLLSASREACKPKDALPASELDLLA